LRHKLTSIRAGRGRDTTNALNQTSNKWGRWRGWHRRYWFGALTRAPKYAAECGPAWVVSMARASASKSALPPRTIVA